MGDRLALQGSLFDDGPAEGAVRTRASFRRDYLTRGAWVDVCPGWLASADETYRALLRDVPWQAEQRQMWDTVVDVPRLLCFYGEDDPLPHDSLVEAKAALDTRYAATLGRYAGSGPEQFATAGLCLYRDGRDSVAWHGDRIGRSRTIDTLVAIVSLGSRRDLMLRPRGGGTSRRYPLGHGDLVVMGGSAQRTWEHCVPKTARDVGPRISVQFRPRGVR
ncbi:putative alkylated DNA repair protein [Nostocoides japonicum T1-X7]|uniref:Putative alkylated DNA repair protein n=1 Tax=Nostocoides japonicum T1-X7 TaxID=1194083 RepID=A0A077M1N3_9MICO|nr:alpha-ketoglutarate-dependent dioxygenase AlkB [Tetrasphaera japonica]CCH78104.1 putative alkylated DNA repair protein [Tetrasphaera japonica T1-X7]